MEENKIVTIIDNANQELLAMKRNRKARIEYEKAYMEGYEACYDYFCNILDNINKSNK